jgi:hypothetical protein
LSTSDKSIVGLLSNVNKSAPFGWDERRYDDELMPLTIRADKQIEKPMAFRRFRLFVRTYKKARSLGFTLVDAIRAALVNSGGA